MIMPVALTICCQFKEAEADLVDRFPDFSNSFTRLDFVQIEFSV